MLDAKLAAGIVDEFHTLDDACLFHQVAGLPQRHMRGDVDDADVLVGQHHRILLRTCKRGVYLCMSVVVVTSQVQRFLVQRSCHGTIHLVGHSQFDGFLDILEGGMTTLWLHLAKLKGREIDALQVEHVDGAKLKSGILDVLHGIHLQVEA